MTDVLEVSGLSAGYHGSAVVRGVDLRVRAGEVVALFGPNGAGKSTTLRTLAGELDALAGTVAWSGRSLEGPLHVRAGRGLAFVPEERSVLMSMSVRDNLRLGRGGVDAALDIFPELKPLLARRAGLLSGGEQQMLALGRALSMRPRILMVDELSLGLAPLAVERLLAAVKDAASIQGIAVLLVEQQARRALGVADRWYLMRRGGIAAEGESGVGGIEKLEAAYLAGSEEKVSV
jgi:branched-chain amino acid transport system ATP-binding protein